MNRYRQYGQNDDQPEVVGDAGFTRLDMLTDPAMLSPGALTLCENFRFDANGTTVRGGINRQLPPGTNIGTILHAAIYKPNQGDDQFALVTMNSLVLFRTDIQQVTVVPFPAGESISAGTNLDAVQAGLGTGTLAQLYLLRGQGVGVLRYDGNTGAVVADSDVPPSNTALYYQDRIVVNNTPQSVSVSDFLDFTSFSVLNQFNLLTGGDDYIVGFRSYQKDYVLIGTRKGWMVAFFDPQLAAGGASSAGYAGALAGDTSFLREVTREAGLVGPRAQIDANGMIFFISDNGIYAFQPQLDNELTVLGRPISAEIQPIMDRFSAKYARGACIERWGYRLYFAMPINDEPIAITGITVTGVVTVGIRLPFTLPNLLSQGSLATVTTEVPHNLNVGDQVLISGASVAALNGIATVGTTADGFTFLFASAAPAGSNGGTRMTMEKIATRNNRIAVFNLNNRDAEHPLGSWESIDVLPQGFYADWLRVADYGSRRRLWLIDAALGPALYEQGDADEIGTVVGGVTLPFRLPVSLSPANYATASITGHFTTRAFRWGYMGTLGGDYTGRMTGAAMARKVRECEVRATLDPDSAGTMTLLVRTPNNQIWSGSRSWTAASYDTADVPLRKLSGQRGLEAAVDMVTTAGRPTFRSVEIETAAVGRVEE